MTRRQRKAEQAARDHRFRLGASRAAAVLGRDPRCSPVKAWLEIRGELDDDGDDDARQLAEAADWGIDLEDIVAKGRRGYEATTGHKVARVNRTLALPGFIEHPQRPGKSMLTCHLDRRVLNVRPGIVYQGKTRDARVRTYWGEPWTDEVPEPELIQCCVEMEIAAHRLVHGAERADLGVLFGGNSFAVYVIERDRELGAALVEQLREWCAVHVVEGREPEPMSEADARMLWRTTSRVAVAMTPRDEEHVRRYLAGAQIEKAGKNIKSAAALQLRKSLRGDAEEIEGEVHLDGQPPKRRSIVTWRMQQAFDAAAFEQGEPELAAKCRTAVDYEAAWRKLRELHGEPATARLLDAIERECSQVDEKAVKKASPETWAKYRIDRKRGHLRVTDAAKARYGTQAEEPKT